MKKKEYAETEVQDGELNKIENKSMFYPRPQGYLIPSSYLIDMKGQISLVQCQIINTGRTNEEKKQENRRRNSELDTNNLILKCFTLDHKDI